MKGTLRKAMYVGHESGYEEAHKCLPMPYSYYELVAKKACDTIQSAKSEEEKNKLLEKYVDFIDTCMEKVDGDIVGNFLKERTAKAVVLIAPPLYSDMKKQVILNDILQGKTSACSVVRLYRVIALGNKALSNKKCLYLVSGYSTANKGDYIKTFKVIQRVES